MSVLEITLLDRNDTTTLGTIVSGNPFYCCFCLDIFSSLLIFAYIQIKSTGLFLPWDCMDLINVHKNSPFGISYLKESCITNVIGIASTLPSD